MSKIFKYDSEFGVIRNNQTIYGCNWLSKEDDGKELIQDRDFKVEVDETNSVDLVAVPIMGQIVHDETHWVKRYSYLRDTLNMTDAINKLVSEVAASSREPDAEKDLIIAGIEEGAEMWKAEYDNCRALLEFLVELKDCKDRFGKNDFYQKNQPLAWEKAKQFLEKYQHQ